MIMKIKNGMKRQRTPRFNYNDFSTENLINSLPENRPLYKDSGLWTIYDDNDNSIIYQNANETFRNFLIRYYELMYQYENMEDIHLNLLL